MNAVSLIGRMTKDPEVRVTPTGEYVASFTLAVNRPYESKDGQKADFISCVVWGKKAENTGNYCSKGSQVGVTGALRSRSYDNSQGQKVYVTEVICDRVEFLDTKKDNQPKANMNDFYQPPVNDNPFDDSLNSFDIMEDDIQF